MRTDLGLARYPLLALYLLLIFSMVSDAGLFAASRAASAVQAPAIRDGKVDQGGGGVVFTSQSSPWSQATVGIVAADFDGDGKSDLALIDSSGISILLGNGDETFRAGPVYPLSECAFIAAADFNRDGRVDLAVTRTNGKVSILLGKGDGTFDTATEYEVGVGPQGLAIGDFNRDGILDLAVANAGLANGKFLSNTVSILLGNGDGTFQGSKNFTTADGPVSVAAADLDSTGRVDLVVATSSPFGVVSVLRGNGDGTFQAAVDYKSSKDPHAVARTVLVADLNNDGALDLVVANETPTGTGSTTEISVLLASGDGTWKPPLTYKPVTAQKGSLVGNLLPRIALADLDGDGNLDLIFAGDGILVQLGNGDGTFRAPALYPVSDATGVAAADLDDDGLIDLVAVGRSITVLRNSPVAVLSGTTGTFSPRPLHTVSPPLTAVLSNPNHVPLKLSGLQLNNGDFSQSSDCGSQLAPGSQCNIAITFSPQSTGLRTGALSVMDFAGRSMNTLALSGAGTAQGPIAALSASSLTFTQVRVATQAMQTVQLTNTGDAPLSITSISTTGAGQFSVTNNCGASVAAAASCTLSVTFSPSFPETQTGTVAISDNAPGSPQIIQLTGSGESLAFSKTNLNFSPVVVGQTSSTLQSVTLFNVGPGAVTFTAIGITGPNAGDFQWLPNSGPQPSCPLPGVLRKGDHCFLSVSFTPSVIGTWTALLSVSDDRDPFPAVLPVSGVGKNLGPVASFSTRSLSFGTVPEGSHKNQNFQLTNSGDEVLSITSVATTEGFSQTNSCGTGLAVGMTCQFTVTFSPGFGGTQSGTLKITDNAPGSPQAVNLTGVGQNIEFSKTSLVFPTVPVGQTTATRSVSVFSLSGNAIVIGTLTGPDAADFQVTSISCGTLGNFAEIRHGDPCIIQLTFTPSGTGTRTAQLVFSNENPVQGPSIVLPLSGNGT